MSEHTLDALIAKIKSEAIEASEKEAKKIVEDAKQKAQQIITKAETDKKILIANAEKQAEGLIEKGKIALNQAARDVQILVKNDIHKLLKAVLEVQVKEAFTEDLYTNVILKLMDNLGETTVIALPSDLADQMVKSIQKRVAESKSTEKIIKKNDLLSGLSVINTDEGWSYDITAEEVAGLLSQHLSPKWAKLLKNS